jgi:plasmid rolling circle replication initiator protein Rep
LYNLDTLAQLSTTTLKPPKTEGLSGLDKNKCNCQSKFQRKAKSKAISNAVVFQLVDVPNSPLTKSYWQTYHCNNVILQDGEKVSSRYCNQRWCIVCNRVRTAKMINGYSQPLSELSDPHFVTLTIPNVPGKKLKGAIEGMIESFTRIRKNIDKTYDKKIKGLRKTECTYNSFRDDYHPHFHLIVDGKDTANKLVDLWLNQYPKADIKAQDVRKANDDTMLELFKYFTKVVNKDKFYPEPMDRIFRAMYKKRVFQPLGIKKEVSEDIEEIQSQEIDFKPFQIESWIYEPESFDWVSADGETFTDYTPTDDELKYLDKITNHKNYTYEEIQNKSNRFEINRTRKTKIESNTKFRKQRNINKSRNKEPDKPPIQQSLFKDKDFKENLII